MEAFVVVQVVVPFVTVIFVNAAIVAEFLAPELRLDVFPQTTEGDFDHEFACFQAFAS